MLYGELGLTPITGDIQARIVSYWSRLLENERAMYTVINRMHKNGSFKSLVEKNVFSGICLSHNVINSKWFSIIFQKENHRTVCSTR